MNASELPQRQARPVESVQRALQVLRLFLSDEASSGLSVTETANVLGVAGSTVSRLMATLAAEGFVTMDPASRRYHVGAAAFQVGSRFRPATMAGAVKPILHDLAAATGHTAQFGTLQHTRVFYLSVADSANRLRVVASPGDSRDAHTSAMGKALLAGLPDVEREAVIRSLLGGEDVLPASGPGTIRDPAALRDELATTRARGYSISREEATADVAALGVTVPERVGIPLALSIAFPSSRYEDDHTTLVWHLTTAAERVAAVTFSAVTDRTTTLTAEG